MRSSLREELLLAAELSDAVGTDVDLRDLADAPLELRGRVLEEGIRVYSGDDVARVALERDLLGRYHDYKDVFRELHDPPAAARGPGRVAVVDKAKLDQMLSNLHRYVEVLRGAGRAVRPGPGAP